MNIEALKEHLKTVTENGVSVHIRYPSEKEDTRIGMATAVEVVRELENGNAVFMWFADAEYLSDRNVHVFEISGFRMEGRNLVLTHPDGRRHTVRPLEANETEYWREYHRENAEQVAENTSWARQVAVGVSEYLPPV